MRGGKREGAGRPPGSTSKKPTRNVYLHIRLTKEEKTEIQSRAGEAGLTLSEYVLKSSLGQEVNQ